MHYRVMDMLQCPDCHGELKWSITEKSEHHIETGEAVCVECAAIYPIREGIGSFLTPDLVREDLWQQVESGLAGYLRTHPETENSLLGVPLEDLAPADQFFRSLILSERGDIPGAKAASKAARSGLYTEEYLQCSRRQTDFALELVSRTEGPIVDLASGQGFLVEKMARGLSRQVVATDFSPRVLRSNRRRFIHEGLDHLVSLLAFDARRTPFRNGVVNTLTTYHGLPNIMNPGDLLGELRRVVSGSFIAITQFYSQDDTVNAKAIEEFGLSSLIFRKPTLDGFNKTGWDAGVAWSAPARVSPTPTGVVIQGAGIDGLPVADTTLDLCVISAR